MRIFCIEIDLAENEMTRIPECVYNVIRLRRLNLSKNFLTEFDVPGKWWYSYLRELLFENREASRDFSFTDGWLALQTLNVSSNRLKALPVGWTINMNHWIYLDVCLALPKGETLVLCRYFCNSVRIEERPNFIRQNLPQENVWKFWDHPKISNGIWMWKSEYGNTGEGRFTLLDPCHSARYAL